MTQEAVEKVIGRWLTDEQFRQRSWHNFETTCRQEGYPLSETEVALLSALNWERLGQAANEIDARLQRAGSWRSPI
jgi:hypothetical protein